MRIPTVYTGQEGGQWLMYGYADRRPGLFGFKKNYYIELYKINESNKEEEWKIEIFEFLSDEKQTEFTSKDWIDVQEKAEQWILQQED